jgi:hypothetical protein
LPDRQRALLAAADWLFDNVDTTTDGREWASPCNNRRVSAGLHVDFARSGGFAGLTLETSVDADSLAPQEQAELERLVRAVEGAGAVKSTRPGVDRFQYDIAISRGKESKRFSVGEADLTPELKALSQWLLERARR